MKHLALVSFAAVICRSFAASIYIKVAAAMSDPPLPDSIVPSISLPEPKPLPSRRASHPESAGHPPAGRTSWPGLRARLSEQSGQGVFQRASVAIRWQQVDHASLPPLSHPALPCRQPLAPPSYAREHARMHALGRQTYWRLLLRPARHARHYRAANHGTSPTSLYV